MEPNDRAIASFTGLGHATFHAFELSIPVFVPVWLGAFDASPTALGLAVGAGYALVGLLAPVAGGLADRFGSRRLVLLSGGGMGVAFAALSVVGSLAALAGVLALWGAAASLYHPAGLSLISRGAERRGRVLAYHGAGGNLGMVVGPLAAVLALVALGWRTVALLLTVPAAVCLLVGLFLRFEEDGAPAADPDGSADGRPDADADGRSAADGTGVGGALDTVRRFLASSRGLFVGGFVVVFGIQMVYGTYYRGVFTFLPDVLGGLAVLEPVTVGSRSVASGQLAYAGLLLVGVGGQYAGGVLSDRLDPERTLLGTFAALVVASVLFVPASRTGVLPLLAVCAALGLLVYVFPPVGQSLVAEYVPEGKHGLSFGYVYLGTFGVGALGAAMAGATLDLGGVPTLFSVLAGLALGCALLTAALLAR
ncbi:MAG: MFS transporter [Haloarculaceae archaeon]|jgi:MFS family permease